MNILQICYSYPPSFSGYGKQLATINNNLIEQNDDMHITVLTAFDGKYHSGNKKNNISIYGFFDNKRTFYKSRIIPYVFSFFVLIRYFKEFYQSDVVHVVKAGAEAAVAVLLCKLFNKPIMVKVVQNDIVSKNERKKIGVVTRLKNLIITKLADRIIAISEQIENSLITHGVEKNRILRIPNSIDTNRFLPKIKTESYNDEIVFLYIGSITIRKGVYDLLQAIKDLHVEKSLKFLFVGPDYNEIKDFQSMITLINQADSYKKVEYIPYTNKPEEILKNSDFFILPSYSEGMPNVVLESFSTEVPTILSDISVHIELSNEKYTRLFKLGDVKDLKNVLLSVIDEKDILLNNKKSAREYVINNHDVSLVARHYYEVYKQLPESKLNK